MPAREALAAVLVAAISVSTFAAAPVRVLYARGGADAHRLEWRSGGEQPVVALDFGGRTVGGYAVFKVKAFTPQGKTAAGKTVGYPVLRLSYATHPDGLSETGCFLRRNCAHYLGPTFDNPVLPANVNRFETYTIARTGTFVAPLIQGQERYVRVQLDTPGTAVELESLEILNVGVHANDKPVGRFRCSDDRVNRSWDMSAWTCNIASFPNGDAWRVVAGRLLPRKLERGTEAGLCEAAEQTGDGLWTVDFELRQNPHHDSAVGMMLHAADKDNGLVVVASQPAYVKVFRREAGRMTELVKMVLDEPIVDGVPHRLQTRADGTVVSVYFDGAKIVSADGGVVAGGKFGLYVEKEWWPVVAAYAVADAKGEEVFADDFSGADPDGRLPGWDYTRSFKYLADGAKRDRLVWIGDLWWAERSCFYSYPVDWPYLRGALELLAWNQNPEGYIWAAPYAEIASRPGKGEFGHFPSDEFTAWFVPVLWDYYLYSGDRKTAERLYPSVRGVLAYLLGHCRADGVFEQRIETSCHAGSMDPKDPRHRFYMNVVLWKALKDGARLARSLGFSADADRWERAAERTVQGTRAAFWDPARRLFRGSLEQPSPHAPGLSLALATGFATPEEALSLAVAIPSNGEHKFHLLGMRGKFESGFDEAAFNMLEGGTWFQLSDPKWDGAQCCTECGFLTRSNWWDESHPDLTVAGVISTYLLGVEPLEPGYRVFRFAPHVVSRLTFAEGEVPTPHGAVSARWERKGDEVRMSLVVPEGTEAELAFRLSDDILVDGVKNEGRRLGPGRHFLVARGVTAKSFGDASLVAAGVPGRQVDNGWYVAPPAGCVSGTSPEFESVQTLDFGQVHDVQLVEIAAADEKLYPSEIRVDVSTDGLTFSQQAELTGLRWPGYGKKLEVDLRTVGSGLPARYVRLRCKRPPATKGEHGDTFYCVRFSKIRVKYRSTVFAAAKTVPKVIFDTDMYTDYDDVGALAALHALADAGECEIIAVGCNTWGEGNRSVAECEVVNAYYGRGDLTVGCARHGGREGAGAAGHGLPAKYPQWVRHLVSTDAPLAVDVYRRAMEAAPDKSVVICSVGFMNNIADLLRADRDLVARKVRLWVCMACSYPNGSEYNSKWDPSASDSAFRNWPKDIPIVWTDFQYGLTCYAGRAVAELQGERDNPVRDVFAANLTPREKVVPGKSWDQLAGHPSWDETAVLIAVRGWEPYFNLERGRYEMVGDKGDDRWVPDAASVCGRVTEKLPKAEVGRLLDEFMCRPPRIQVDGRMK